MENGIMVEENIQTNHSDLASKKSAGSSIKIDSISIDLVNNYRIDASQCEHFSIRGYVTGIRNKNWKMCCPFALDDNNRKPEEQICSLPPLHVPKFRWWSCQNCLKEVTAEGIPENSGHVCSSSIFKSSGTCPNVSPGTDVKALENAPQQDTELNIRDGRNINTSVANSGLNGNDDEKGSKSGSLDSPVTGHPNGSEDNVNLEIPISAGEERGSISGMIPAGDDLDDKVAHKTNCDGASKICKPSCHESHKISEVANKDLECMVENSVKIYQTEKQHSAEETHPDLLAAKETVGTAEMVGVVDSAVKNITRRYSEHPSPEVGCYDNASSESGEALANIDLQDPDDNLSGSHRRKTRKVRLLTDLLAANGDVNTNLPRTESVPSNSVASESARIDLQSGHQGLISGQASVDKDLDRNRKRKFLHDEEFRPLGTSSSDKFLKEFRNYNEGAESTHGHVSSNSEEDASLGFQIGKGSKLSKCRFDKNPIKGKKKNKKTPVADEFLSLGPSEENVPKPFQNTAEHPNSFTAADNSFYKFAQTTFPRRGTYPFPLPPQKAETHSALSKKKSKMARFDDEQASCVPWSNGMLKECLLSRKDAEIMQANITTPFQSAQDASTEKGFHLSFNSRLSAQSYDRKYVSQQEERPLAWLGGTPKETQVIGKDFRNYIGESNHPYKREQDAYRQKEVHLDLGSNSYGMSFLNEKPKSCSQVQQMDYFGTGNGGKFVEMKDNLTSSRKVSNQRVDKLPEQSVPDDIPMEIVELMAKNQYERCLPDVENDKRQPETNINTYNAQIHAKGNSDFLSEDAAHRPKPRSKSSGKIMRAENVVAARQRPVDPFSNAERRHPNFSQLEQTYVPLGLSAFPQSHEKSQTGLKFSAAGSSKHGSSQNYQWMGHRCSQSNLQTLGACNTYPQQMKEVSPWSSMMSNPMPFSYNVPQKNAGPSNNTDVRPHCSSSQHKGNLNGNHDLHFSNVPPSKPEKHLRNLDPENLGRQNSEYPFSCRHSGTGSLDLYSNETIPALHLLSLMEDRMRSGGAIEMDHNRKSLNRPPFAPEHHLKDLSGVPSRGYNTSTNMEKLSYNFHGNNHVSENSREIFTAIPRACSSGFPLQSDKHVEKNCASTKQSHLKYKERQKKAKCSDSPSSKGMRSPTSVFTGGSGVDFASGPIHSTQKLLVGKSDPKLPPLHFHESGNATKNKTTDVIWPPRSCPSTEICSLNRNPADLFAPGPENPYMIRGEDLKFKKPVLSEKRAGQIKLDGHKRQKKSSIGKGKVNLLASYLAS